MMYIGQHITEYVWSEGVPDYWVQTLQPFIDGAIIILSSALPIVAVFYTIVIGVRDQQEYVRATLVAEEEPVFVLLVDGIRREYTSISGAKRALTRFVTSGQDVELPDNAHDELVALLDTRNSEVLRLGAGHDN
jgi:hypothetical protein